MSQIQNSFLQRNRVSQPSLLAKQRKTNVILFSISLIFFVTWLPFRYLSVFVFFTFSQYIQGICKCICLCHLPSFQVFVFVFASSLSPSSSLYFIFIFTLSLLYFIFTLLLLYLYFILTLLYLYFTFTISLLYFIFLPYVIFTLLYPYFTLLYFTLLYLTSEGSKVAPGKGRGPTRGATEATECCKNHGF